MREMGEMCFSARRSANDFAQQPGDEGDEGDGGDGEDEGDEGE
ncbi:MAG TPA: hypothetical protein V6D25_16975 [Leptolyngbyaceae cyanobacterium]